MGTTVIAAKFASRRPRVYVGHVGDSRCYRMRDGDFRLLTIDHTLGAQGVQGPMAVNLRRAIGMADRIKVDLLVDRPHPGDLYLLCSDGLSKMLSEDDLKPILANNSAPKDICAKLIQAANDSGGLDNVTVVVVSVSDPEMRPNP
jgi:protein phosphatase